MSLTDTFNTTPQSTLKNLIQVLHDGEEGFKKAAEGVEDSALKSLFGNFSIQRARFATELETHLRSFGEDSPQGTTVTGSIHRTWIDIKSALSNHDEHAILAEAERGEDAAVKAYMDTLDERELPDDLREVVARQAADVKAAHDQVKRLRDATKKS